jgi:aminoglycoside/choline kinase family phosphotransferase
LLMSASVYNEPLSRAQQRQAFLAKHGYAPEYCSLLAADASPRQYYRWQYEGKSLVLMDTPISEKPEQFCRISQLLRDINLSAPEIVVYDFDQGFLLLEDLGDQTYTRALTSDNTTALYTLAIKTLIHLHQHQLQKVDFVDCYTSKELLREAMLFLEWYYPEIEGKKPSLEAIQQYESVFYDAFTTALAQQPHRLVLRDYHIDNLILLSSREGIQRCGLLDFQCALWGPIGYDVVSLLEDARRDVDPFLKEQLWQVYGAAFPELNLEILRQSSAVLSVGRHLKILGIFMRLAIRDGKKEYLAHLPRIERLLKISLAEANLPDLTLWFKTYMSHLSHAN